MAAVQHPPRMHSLRPSPFSSQYRPRADVSDSDSDNEPPPAIKFSKVTEAFLNDRPIPSSPIKHESSHPIRSTKPTKLTLGTPSRPGIKIVRKSSPMTSRDELGRGSTPPRIVQIGSGEGSARRTISISGPYPHRLASRSDSSHAVVTPGPADRGLTLSRANSVGSQAAPTSASRPPSRGTTREQLNTTKPLDVHRFLPSTINRTRTADQALPPGSQRVKRGPIATGTFLKSGPMRRGFRRRESEDNVSPTDEYNNGALSAGSSAYTPQDVGSRSDSINTRATSVEPISVHDFANEKNTSRPDSRQGQVQRNFSFRPPSRQDSHEPPQISSEQQPVKPAFTRDPHILERLHKTDIPASTLNRQYRYVGGEPRLGTYDDQENVPPPTFKRNKDQEFRYLGQVQATLIGDDKSKLVDHSPLPSHQPERKVLAPMSDNLPHRPPPPPPKMSVLETATATAGASTTKSRKKRTHVVLNGKIFTQMGKIGKGGSSDVYCVMAENFKTFAMKKVKLEDCDASAVRGYKGEIDLLKKLTEVDRVIRLYDWELNEEKQELLVLMEKGDTDLNRVLTQKINTDDAKLDTSFTRFHWKEMLECVQAVHEHDIVHSDLKPANFLVVQGRLKLIDFGIANAIDIDNTCNVHRDSHVGTPNYMSPESITDTNAPASGSSSRDAQGRPLKKDMRIGKSSDVWSLGCILYQMTYGRPPFAHITNQITRIMAITNEKHVIEFPETGLGGITVPPSLRGTLRRCLQREADLRPTIPQLLADTDEFLNPEANGAVMVRQEVLDQIINKVVERCRDSKRGLPTQAEVAQYAPSFMLKIREMAEKV